MIEDIIDQKKVAQIIAQMEDLESQQLNLGITNTYINIPLLQKHIQKESVRAYIPEALQWLKIHGEVLEIEPGVYRSRMAETTRCIRLVRQRFSKQPLSKSLELVEAVRTVFRSRRRPDRSQIKIEDFIQTGEAHIDADLRESLMYMIKEGLGWETLSAFQQRSFETLYTNSDSDWAKFEAAIIAGDTGAGKTEAFLFPLLARIAQRKRDLKKKNIYGGVGAVLVYPRIKLAMNQLERIAKIVKLWELYGGPTIRIGVQNANVASSYQYMQSVKKAQHEGTLHNPRSIEMNLIPCPFKPSEDVKQKLSANGSIEIDSRLVFKDDRALRTADDTYPMLVSAMREYWTPQDQSAMTEHQKKPDDGIFKQLLVTKSALFNTKHRPEEIPDILIITDKSLSQYLVQLDAQHLWGLWSENSGDQIAPPAFLVMDEIHLLNGLDGAHLSRIISRFQARVELAAKKLQLKQTKALPVGVSATLYSEQGFMGKILGMLPNESQKRIALCKPRKSEDEQENELIPTKGRERYVFVRPHEAPDPNAPEKRVGGMAAAIQIVMASMHNLMPADLGALHQYKGLAFFDSVNSVNLFEQYYNMPQTPTGRIGANKANLFEIRTHNTCRKLGARDGCPLAGSEGIPSYNRCPTFLSGDCWPFAQKFGWDHQLDVSDANYSGTEVELRKSHLIPTSPSLEVGYDDDTIQFVYQHMAPNNVAAFIQRRGRAGRDPEQSPVIVTLLWPYRARDLFYFYRPNYLYDPSFDDIPLNARNGHVQLTHAFLGLFDYLAAQTAADAWSKEKSTRVREALSKNYVRFYGVRQNWRHGLYRSWGSAIVDRVGPQLQAYIEQQQPNLGPEIAAKALELLKVHFFEPSEHRILADNAKPWDLANFFKTFKRVDFNLQGDGGESIVEVSYPPMPNTHVTQQEGSKGLSTPLERGLFELLPGNATFRLRVDTSAYWTPIREEYTSTYLYPDEASESAAVGDGRSLFREQNTLMGIPKFLKDLYPHLLYFTPKNVRAERFRRKNSDPLWLYDPNLQITLPTAEAKAARSTNKYRNMDIQAQSFASSLIIPYMPSDDAAIERPVIPPKQLDQIFDSITAYLDRPIGYLQVLYEYTISLRLTSKSKRSGGNDETYPRIKRLFYGPKSTSENPDPRMAAYKVETQGIEFTVSPHFCRRLALDILGNKELCLHFRQQYVIYQLGKNAHLIDRDLLPLRITQLARLIVTYWLAIYVPLHRANPESLNALTTDDLRAVYRFAQGEHRQWSGEQSVELLFEGFSVDNEQDRDRVSALLRQVNRVLREGFTDSREFREYLESVALHSLASVIKNHCALLGGVSSDALVVYADLSLGLEYVSRPEIPRILVFDTVAGGSGAIGQVFDNLSRQPNTPVTEAEEERNLWSLLQTDIGKCPVGEGEALLRNLLLSISEEDANAMIQRVRERGIEGLDVLKDEIVKQNLVLPDKETLETVARVLYANDVYVANSADPNDDGANEIIEERSTTFLGSSEAIKPPFIVHELLRQEQLLQQKSLYRPQPETVVAQALLNIDRWQYIKRLRDAMEQDIAKDNAIKNKDERIRSQMNTQLLNFLPRRCEDGCPVCMVNGSDMENSQLAPYLNSRRILRRIREMLLVDSLTPTTEPEKEIIGFHPTRIDGDSETTLMNMPLAGALRTTTISEDGHSQTTTLVPATYIDRELKSRPLSLFMGQPVDSAQEAAIANYLEVRKTYNAWTYKYKERYPFLVGEEEKEIVADFLVRVPYQDDDIEYLEDFYIEYWETEEDTEERRFKKKYYRSLRREVIHLEDDDMIDNRFAQKIDAAITDKINNLLEKQTFELPQVPMRIGVPPSQIDDVQNLDEQEHSSEISASQAISPTAHMTEEGIMPEGDFELTDPKDVLKKITVKEAQAFELCNRKGILLGQNGHIPGSPILVNEFIQSTVAAKALELCRQIKFRSDAHPPLYPINFTLEEWNATQRLLMGIEGQKGPSWSAQSLIEQINKGLREIYAWALPMLQKRGPFVMLDSSHSLSAPFTTETASDVTVETHLHLLLQRSPGIFAVKWQTAPPPTSTGNPPIQDDRDAAYAAYILFALYPGIAVVHYAEMYVNGHRSSASKIWYRTQLEEIKQYIQRDIDNVRTKKQENIPTPAAHCRQCVFALNEQLCASGHNHARINDDDLLYPEGNTEL